MVRDSRFAWIAEQGYRGAFDTPVNLPSTLVLVLRNYDPQVQLSLDQFTIGPTPYLDHQKTAGVPIGQAPLIYANQEALDLLWDFTLTSQLAVTLVKNFEINNNEPVDLNRVHPTIHTLPNGPADRQWLYEQLQRAFWFALGNHSQKHALAQAVDWASDWTMTRARFLMTTARDDPRTHHHLYNVTGDRRGDVWMNSSSSAIHKPNLLQDWYIVSMTQNPFRPPKSLWPQFESTAQFQAAGGRLFEHIYRVRLEDAQFLYDLIHGHRGATQNAVNIFTWLVAYIDRYLRWRCQAFEALSKKSFCKLRKHQRWVLRVDHGFRTFLVYFRRLLNQQRTYTKLRLATWVKTYFCIQALNALVRLCKLNYTIGNNERTFQEYSKSIGKPHNFPNFVHNVSILRSQDEGLTAGYVPAYDDVCDAPRTHFPWLEPGDRFPNDPSPPPFNPGQPGGRWGNGGPRGYGGFEGLGGFQGRGGPRGGPPWDRGGARYGNEDSDPEDQTVHKFANTAPDPPIPADQEIDSDDDGSPAQGERGPGGGGDGDGGPGGGGNGGGGDRGGRGGRRTPEDDKRDWWITQPDSTGGWEDGLPNWSHYTDGTTRAGVRDEGELDEDMESTRGEDWSSDESGGEPASDDEQDEDELLLENPSERSQENKRKIEIAEELKAEAEAESATIRAPDGLTRPNRASPVFASSVPKYHLRVKSWDGSNGTTATNGSDTTIVVRRPVQPLELSDISDALREAVMSRGGYSAPTTRGVSKRSRRRSGSKGMRRRTLPDLVV